MNNEINQDFITYIMSKEQDFEGLFAEMILRRLSFFKYEIKEENLWDLKFAIKKVINHIKNKCHICKLPFELYEIATDMVVGNFFFELRKQNKIDIKDLDLEVAVKQIQLGDTNINFATENSETGEQMLNALINYLMNSGEEDLLCYRVLM